MPCSTPRTRAGSTRCSLKERGREPFLEYVAGHVVDVEARESEPVVGVRHRPSLGRARVGEADSAGMGCRAGGIYAVRIGEPFDRGADQLLQPLLAGTHLCELLLCGQLRESGVR